MKWTYLIGLLLVILMIGCSAPEEDTTAADAAAADAAAAEAVAAEAAATEAAAAEAAVAEAAAAEAAAAEPADDVQMIEPDMVDTSEFTDSQLAQMESLKAACQKGSLGLCTALKTHYGIDMSPGDAMAEAPVDDAMTDDAMTDDAMAEAPVDDAMTAE